MPISVYNTLSRKKEVFTPIIAKKVSFYVCGVTVYDYCHIGHARAYVAFDCIRRYLEYSGFDVTYIQNFTDIDDKIITKANETKKDYLDITNTYIQAYFDDMTQLHIKSATGYPRATEYLDQIIELIQHLLDKNIAYEINGDICFSVETFKDYGKLSKKVLEDLMAGARVDVNQNKKSPLDFVLWKQAKPEEPSWDSPWGKGRPGWHIECSAMVKGELGDSIDIHAGGADLIFPHHENEIAQSESCTEKPLASYWLHNGFVTIQDEKMSKSKKNFITLNEIFKSFKGDVVRFYLMKAHYRSPLNFSYDGLKEAQAALEKLTMTFHHFSIEKQTAPTSEQEKELQNFEQMFISSMDDDFNYAEAIGVLFELNKYIHVENIGTNTLLKLGQIIGLFQEDLSAKEEIEPAILALIEQRQDARKNKDFLKADEIRAQLYETYKIIIEDKPDGVTWRKVTD